jgi:L-2,4-diaminobutyrate decarboxylase
MKPSLDIATFHAKIFSQESFRKYTEVVASQLGAYLENISVRGLAMQDPEDLMRKAKSLMTSKHDVIDDFDEGRFRSIVDLYIRTGIPLYSPGYMGRQFSGVVPLTGIFDMVNAILNQPSSFYEAAQLPNVAERIMADELNEYIGYDPEKFTMVTTSGGSLANLTALMAARNDKFPDIWTKGLAACCRRGSQPALAVSKEAHYSIIRSAGILGIGEDNIVKLPVDDYGRIDDKKVPGALDNARAKGLDVFCMVASAGTTSLGAFDPIDALAQIASKYNIWLHIDGSHGASLLLSDTLRRKMYGIQKADSIAWDAHKMMFVPSPCSLLFYKDKSKSYAAFHQEASYVFEKYPDKYTAYDSAGKNFECTKRPMIMNLWILWAIYGRALFAQKIELLYELCRQAYQIVEHASDFEAVHSPESNILCFRHRHPFAGAIPDYHVQIRNSIRQNGVFFISKVEINNSPVLRVVFMNHLITIAHFRTLLDEIRKAGLDIVKEYKNHHHIK